MKTKLIILLFLLIPIVDLFYSCCPCDVTTQYICYSHKTLFVKNLDNSGEKAIESEALQLNKNAYGVRLYVTREKTETIVRNTNHINSIFIQSAYATSCQCPPAYIYAAKDSIISIKILTLNSFDNQHVENSDITDYFKIAYSNINDYVANMHYTYECDYEKFLEKELIIDLLLMTAPTVIGNQLFKIQILLSDGRILEQQTKEVNLL